MAITKRTELAEIIITVNGVIQVRTDTVYEEDGVEVGRQIHRGPIEPDADPSAIANDKLRAIATAMWTPDVVAAFKIAKDAQRKGLK